MKDNLRKNLAKKKATEDELMEQAEQEQKDNLAFHTEPTGGASSSQGPLPPKTPRTPKVRIERSRSRDNEPKEPNTPK